MKNKRPDGLFGDLDYGWKGTTLNERIQAQNLYDVGVAQEEANKLMKEKMEQEKMQSKLKREHELKMQKQNQEFELKKQQMEAENKKNIQKEAYENELYLQNRQLCREHNIVYSDLQKFESIVCQVNRDIDKENKILADSTEKLQYCNVLLKDIDDKEEKLKRLREIKREARQDLSDPIYLEGFIQKIINMNSVIVGCVYIFLVMILGSAFVDNFESIIVPTTIIFILIAISVDIWRAKQINKSKETLNNQIKDCDNQIENIYDILNKNKSRTDIINERQAIIDYTNEAVMSSGNYSEEYDKFNKFRLNYYNQEMEDLLKDLGMKFKPIYEDEAIGKGTVNDYKNYIKKVLRNNQ